MEWVYNDGGRSKYFTADKVGDCAVRAIAIGTGKDYKEVYNELKALNHGKSCRNGTPKDVDKKWLREHGWVWHPTMKIGSGCTTHLKKDELPSGTLIVQVSGHLTCVKDGVIYDTYDCSRGGTRCVYGYWTPSVKNEKKYKVVLWFKDEHDHYREYFMYGYGSDRDAREAMWDEVQGLMKWFSSIDGEVYEMTDKEKREWLS